MPKKAAYGSGSVRKKVVEKNGKRYTYWEARYSAGRDPATGKLISKSISGKTQKEVTQKLREVTANLDDGSYTEPSKMTVKQWFDIWQETYLVGYSPSTVVKYKIDIKKHIIPFIGAVPLQQLEPHTIQKMLNGLSKTMSPKSVKNIHGLLHKALQQALENDIINQNPSDRIKLPKRNKPELQCLEPEQVAAFLEAAKGDAFENLMTVAMFTGMRRGELLGLTWDCIDFDRHTIYIKHQLQRIDNRWILVPPKENKTRTIYPAVIVFEALKKEQEIQDQCKQEHEEYFSNPMNLVFTSSIGGLTSPTKIQNHFKGILEKAGLPDIRFHDIRHTYAVNSLQAGDDIKTLQDNLGHATAAFTLDVYSQAIAAMKKNSADRMQAFYEEKLKQKPKK